MAMSGSSLCAPVNSRVSGSAVAKNAASIVITPAQRREHLPLQLGDVEAAAADAQHCALCAADVGHASSVAAAVRRGNPTLLGWFAACAAAGPFRHDHRPAHPQQAPRRELHPGALHQGRPHGRRPLRRARLRQPRPAVPRRARRAPRACATPRRSCRRALPDWRSDADHYIAEGDLVVEHFHAYGTRTGELIGVPRRRQVARPARHPHLPHRRRQDRRTVGVARLHGLQRTAHRRLISSTTSRRGRPRDAPSARSRQSNGSCSALADPPPRQRHGVLAKPTRWITPLTDTMDRGRCAPPWRAGS